MRGKKEKVRKARARKTAEKRISRTVLGVEGAGRARRFTAAFRRQAEALLRKAVLAGRSASSVAEALGGVVTPQTLCLWGAALCARDPKFREAWKARKNGGRKPSKLKRAA